MKPLELSESKVVKIDASKVSKLCHVNMLTSYIVYIYRAVMSQGDLLISLYINSNMKFRISLHQMWVSYRTMIFYFTLIEKCQYNNGN